MCWRQCGNTQIKMVPLPTFNCFRQFKITLTAIMPLKVHWMNMLISMWCHLRTDFLSINLFKIICYMFWNIFCCTHKPLHNLSVIFALVLLCDNVSVNIHFQFFQVFHTFIVSFNEQRRPVMPLLTAMKRTPQLSAEQKALRQAWDTLAEKVSSH